MGYPPFFMPRIALQGGHDDATMGLAGTGYIRAVAATAAIIGFANGRDLRLRQERLIRLECRKGPPFEGTKTTAGMLEIMTVSTRLRRSAGTDCSQ